jgi:hypothetical protein
MDWRRKGRRRLDERGGIRNVARVTDEIRPQDVHELVGVSPSLDLFQVFNPARHVCRCVCEASNLQPSDGMKQHVPALDKVHIVHRVEIRLDLSILQRF